MLHPMGEVCSRGGLEAEGRSVDDYQVSKQTDVLMLFYLLSADELRQLLGGLGYALPPEAIPRTIEYYLARTSHGSTLSALVHAWVLARANRAQALEHFERAVVSDLADIQGGTTAEGVHLDAMAGSVDLLQRCFAGLETRHDALWFNPHWPRSLGRLEFAVEYRGRPITVRVVGREVTVSAGPGGDGSVRIGCGSEVCELRPGETMRFWPSERPGGGLGRGGGRCRLHRSGGLVDAGASATAEEPVRRCRPMKPWTARGVRSVRSVLSMGVGRPQRRSRDRSSVAA
ncbi:hypothetical protein BJF90_10355 [Pseudonocardia sp. CNS-004]|nr:hypothetical protein BJF90_10355 [Pseudonocardia sp. CNS-004]